MSEFVSFRAGALAAEFGKRGDNSSAIAKRHLTQHFDGLAVDRRELQRKFSLNETRFLMVALRDVKELGADNLSRSFQSNLEAQTSLLPVAAKFDLSIDALAEKLSALSHHEAFALVDAVEQFRQMDLADVMAGLLPKPQFLQQIGLIAPDGPVAWGRCAVRLENYRLELVLRPSLEDMGDLPEDDLPIERLMQNLVDYAEVEKNSGTDDGIRNLAYRSAYAIARKSRFPRFSVLRSEPGKALQIHEMNVVDLVEDLYSKSMPALSLAGVNAP